MTARTRKAFEFWQVDAFSDEPYKGNAAAVVFEAAELTPDQMQTIARQMNLSETAFLSDPLEEGSYRVRIFTPTREVPFAGHPTIASAFAHASTHKKNGIFEKTVLLQECAAGMIEVAVTDDEPPTVHPGFEGRRDSRDHARPPGDRGLTRARLEGRRWRTRRGVLDRTSVVDCARRLTRTVSGRTAGPRRDRADLSRVRGGRYHRLCP